jgi:signal peptidase I
LSRRTQDEAASDENVYQKPILRDYVETILICVIFVIFSRAFVFQQSKIPSGSMEDTLLVGDYIMVNRFLYAPTSFGWENALLPTKSVQRGDIVVFKQPNEPEVDYIKRVIGLPGDTIEVRGGVVYVNGEALSEAYIKEKPNRMYGPVTVPEGKYFMMGDNRNNSVDSRVWGAVQRNYFEGRALLVFWPPNRIHIIQHHFENGVDE